MNKYLVFISLFFALTFMSCQSKSEKADDLRLENRFEEAAELYQQAANEGDAYAKWRLFEAYANGDGVEYDEKKALNLLKEAAKGGCEEAICDLSYTYMFGWYNSDVDVKKGKTMLDKLVTTTDNAYVLTRYARLLFFDSTPYEEDKDKAMNFLNKVKDKNNAEYLFMMGYVYGLGSEKNDIDIEKSTRFLTKAFRNGRKKSASILAAIYQSGYGNVKPDRKKAIEWLNRGIEANSTDCMTDMARLCFSEDSINQDLHNPQRGLELLKKASKRGNGKANNDLGWEYYEGKYVVKDDKKAFDYYQKATDLGNADGAFHLGFAYIDGTGCDKDLKKGIETWKLAVEYGSGEAANNLFCYYNNGSYAKTKDVINKKLAKKYLLKAAELGDDVACFNLGREYFWGNNLFEKNDSQAFIYMKKAADMGNIDACGWLSEFYDKGIGCDKDPKNAKEYHDKTK